MENFKSFITENKNTHMTHLEDKVIYGLITKQVAEKEILDYIKQINSNQQISEVNWIRIAEIG